MAAMLNILVSSSSNSFGSERRFSSDISIRELKNKLELLTGSICGNMQLSIYNKENQFICYMGNDDQRLEDFGVEDGFRLHVNDPTIPVGEFEDVSKVEKYVMPDEKYASKGDSVLAFKQQHKLGRFREVSDQEKQQAEQAKLEVAQEEEKLALQMVVGSRCEVTVKDQPSKRGVVSYVGLTDFKPGFWIGVSYDEPVGKNDGSVNGKRYFQANEKYGGFVKPQFVRQGDFPPHIDEEMEEM